MTVHENGRYYTAYFLGKAFPERTFTKAINRAIEYVKSEIKYMTKALTWMELSD